MENKINIAELLEDCPKGMELYSPIFGKVYLDKVRPHLEVVVTTDKYKEEFLYDGRYGMNGECMLFPSKEKTTWEGFQRPFKDGDIVYVKTINHHEYILIFKEIKNDHIHKYVCFTYQRLSIDKCPVCQLAVAEIMRLATEEEKAKLFQAIKENGYYWDAETKTLEKLQMFKVGDKVKRKEADYTYIVTIAKLDDDYYDYVNEDGQCGVIHISTQNDWELVPNKFDITTLKPFDKVLVRDNNEQFWTCDWFSFHDTKQVYPFACVGHYVSQCIPYEGNEHLLGTTDDCDEYFKNWELV